MEEKIRLNPNREFKVKLVRYIILTILFVIAVIFLFKLIFSYTL